MRFPADRPSPRNTLVPPLGCPIGVSFQRVPLPDAEYVVVPAEPSAVHDDAELHETAMSCACGGVPAPFGSGAVAVVHDFPFQVATTG
jgi:hypothetical protein